MWVQNDFKWIFSFGITMMFKFLLKLFIQEYRWINNWNETKEKWKKYNWQIDHGSFKIRLDISLKKFVCRFIDMMNSLKVPSCVFKMLLHWFFSIQAFLGLNLVSNGGVYLYAFIPFLIFVLCLMCTYMLVGINLRMFWPWFKVLSDHVMGINFEIL